MTVAFRTSQQALDWMLERTIIVKSKSKDPETLARIQGFLLSNEMRERVGVNLVELVSKASRKKSLYHVTVRDAFLTATIAALLQSTRSGLSEDDMTRCANIVFALLPIGRLEQADLADRPLWVFARDRNMVGELQRTLGLRS